MIRNACVSDVPAIRTLINYYAELDKMLFRSPDQLYENLRDFQVYEDNKGQIAGCCALHIIWEDLAEIKSLAVRNDMQGRGIGSQLVQKQLSLAREMHIPKVFTLTLEENFFQKQGFVTITKDKLPMKVWSDCVYCPKQDHCDEIAMVKTIEN